MADVFISHSSKDFEIAEQICMCLEQRGVSCWMAPRDIVPGVEWPAAISTAVSTSKVFLLIYSENSVESTEVPREITLASKITCLLFHIKLIILHLVTSMHTFFQTHTGFKLTKKRKT